MKKLIYDGDNIGGLYDVYAIAADAYEGVTLDYSTGVNSLTLDSDDNNIICIPVYADESFNFTESHGRDENGDFWSPNITGAIPCAAKNAELIEELEMGEWVCVSVDHLGNARVSGDSDTPLTFSTETNSGTMYADRNCATFSMTGTLGHASIVVELTII